MPKILIVLTSHGELGDTGRTTGFYVPEAAHPFRVLTEAGYEVDFASIDGGRPPRDGVKPDDTGVAKFLLEQEGPLSATPAIADIDPSDYTAVVLAGGHGTMWDFPESKALISLVAGIHNAGGVVGAVCHGPAGLVNVRLADNQYLVDGRQVSAFTNEEEQAVGLTDTVPFLLETALIEHGAQFTKAPNFSAHAVADDRLVTGQNPASATQVAELVATELSRVGRSPVPARG